MLASKPCNNLKELEAEIMKHVNTVLNKEVAIVVKESIQSAVSSEVYSKGFPEYYDRRGGNKYGGMGEPKGTGSLADVDQMHHTVSGGTLVVTDDAEPSSPWGKRLDQAISFGYGYEKAWYEVARPFFPEAIEDLKSSKAHVEALKDGLEDIFGKGNVR